MHKNPDLYSGHYRLLAAFFLTAACYPANAITYDNLTINGYMNVEYENHVSGDEKGDTEGSFDLDRFDLVLNFQANDRVRVAADLAWEHGAVSEDGRGNVGVEYGFAEFTQNDWLKFRAGKMFTAFGIYNEIQAAKPAVLSVKEPRSTNKIDRLGSDLRFFAFQQTGVAVLGGGDLGGHSLDYILQVGNGGTEGTGNPYEEDDNTHKSLNGRFQLGITDSLLWGVSFYQDKMADADGAGTPAELNSYGTSLQWTLPQETGIEFEYIMGEQNIEPAMLDRDGYSVMVFHPFGRITPYLRYEAHDPDKDTDDDNAGISIAGINFAYSKGVHMKAELDQINSSNANSRLGGSDYLEFKAAISLGF